MSDIAIKVQNLSKRYRIGLKEETHETLSKTFVSWIKSPIRNFRNVQRLSKFNNENNEDIIWAVKDISIEVKKGEVIGIIGENGAGKSTLLKLLAQIIEPTSGSAEINGRVASLLEVGTGFHRELTGRENIYLNGTILGMTKREIDSKFREIIDFSGIEKFIDTPVKRYSSGMRVRLAFSVAAHLEPEILLIDEVLAVGDIEFQRKCLGKMKDITSVGRTVFFVSHNMAAIESICGRVILLDKGNITYQGDKSSTIAYYLNKNKEMAILQPFSDLANRKDRHYKHQKLLKSIAIMDYQGKPSNNFRFGDMIVFEIGFFDSIKNIKTPNILITINDEREVSFITFSSSRMTNKPIIVNKENKIKFIWDKCNIKQGEYIVLVKVKDMSVGGKGKDIDRIQNAISFQVEPFPQKTEIIGTEGFIVPYGKWEFYAE